MNQQHNGGLPPVQGFLNGGNWKMRSIQFPVRLDSDSQNSPTRAGESESMPLQVAEDQKRRGAFNGVDLSKGRPVGDRLRQC